MSLYNANKNINLVLIYVSVVKTVKPVERRANVY